MDAVVRFSASAALGRSFKSRVEESM